MGVYSANPKTPTSYPADYANSVVVMPQQSGSGSSLQKIINSGTPITSGNSANTVSSTASSLGSLSGLNFNFDNLFNLIKENTQSDNAWSAAQAQKQMDFQTQSNQIAMDFNAAEAAKNRDWQEMMSNSAHVREIADLKAAGLNPVLSATGGNGAPVTSGSAASGVTSSGAMADPDQSMNTALASIYTSLINAQTSMYNTAVSAKANLQISENQKEASMYGSELASEASRYAAGTNYAASTYATDRAFENNEAQRQWNADHPSNAYQAGATLFGADNINSARNGVRTIIDGVSNLIDSVTGNGKGPSSRSGTHR